MITRIRNGILPAAMVLLAALQLGGCTTNPATGGSTFTGGMSRAQEIRIGRENHPKIVKEFGGEYGTPELRRYVDGIGQLLARTAERRDLKFTFTVLNSDIVNAFATPGGYVYVTRGLLTLADTEAQLAGVLAHEIGHITALHHARRYGQSILANIGLAAVGILGGRGAAQLGQIGAVSLLKSFSRENEYESDQLGIRYLARAGFNPFAMAGFLKKLRADSRLMMKRRGDSPDKIDQFNYLATHPAPAARVERATRLARQVQVRNPADARDIYLRKINGMLYGDDPDQGFIRGRDFLHARMRFGFSVPEGFNMFNTPSQVIAFGPNGARIVFDQARKPSDGSMRFYLGKVWGRNLRLSGLESIRVNGLDAATASARIRTRQGMLNARLVAYRVDLQTIYRFIFIVPRGQEQSLSTGLRRTTYSFRRLDEREARSLRPLAIRIVTVKPGDTVAGLGRKMPYARFNIERFRVLNGLSANQPLQIGRKLKTVVERWR